MSASGAAGIDRAGLAAEATQLLQELVRMDTVNPPGREREAQESLAELLSQAGFRCELLGAEPQRPNLVARLGAEGAAAAAGPTLCYLGHVDTVLADPDEWAHGPWSGELADGFLWGRGSIDMKSQVAAEVAAAVTLARSGWRPARGELLIVTVVDEETGGRLGAEWITREHPEKVRCDMLLNEGAGAVFEHGGVRHYGVCCAEKGVFRFALTTEGRAGHASMPMMGENALLRAAPLLQRLAARQPSYRLVEQTRALLQGLGEDPEHPGEAVARIAAAEPRLRVLLEPMLGVTFTPTMIRASQKINVIPSSCEVRVDCRVPPGLGEEAVRAGIAEVLGAEDGFRLDFTEKVAGNASPLRTELMGRIGEWISERDPGARVVPIVMPGFTDSRHFRLAFPECVAYGFFPQTHQSMPETMSLMHAADERIDLRDLALAGEFYLDLALRLLG